MTALFLLIVPVSYGAWGVLMMSSAIFNSLGRPVSATIMSIVRMLVIYVPLAWPGKSLFGLPGIFGAACVSNLSMGLIGFLWNRRVFVPMIALDTHQPTLTKPHSPDDKEPPAQ